MAESEDQERYLRDNEEDLGSEGGEGARNAEATPEIGEDAKPGQTQTPPLEGDVGVPPEEELGDEERER